MTPMEQGVGDGVKEIVLGFRDLGLRASCKTLNASAKKKIEDGTRQIHKTSQACAAINNPSKVIIIRSARENPPYILSNPTD